LRGLRPLAGFQQGATRRKPGSDPRRFAATESAYSIERDKQGFSNCSDFLAAQPRAICSGFNHLNFRSFFIVPDGRASGHEK
jgi:hypothetical protein